MEQSNYEITFWGVRGSRPVANEAMLEFGGNTPCVQIEINNQLLILDAGTGICNLGDNLLTNKDSIQGNIFITHTHWDHIQGFPFFKPAFKKNNRFNIYGKAKLEDLLRQQMAASYFPIQIDDLSAELEFNKIKSPDTILLDGDIKVKTLATNHPGGCISFRINYQDSACCYLTDIEPGLELNQQLIEFIKGADVVIYDASYTNSEYVGDDESAGRQGWGHSTWQEGIRYVQAAKADKLVLFHHLPQRTDKKIKQIEQQAQASYVNAIAAKEGMVISL